VHGLAACGACHLCDSSIGTSDGHGIGIAHVDQEAYWIDRPQEDRVAEDAIHGWPVLEVVVAMTIARPVPAASHSPLLHRPLMHGYPQLPQLSGSVAKLTASTHWP